MIRHALFASILLSTSTAACVWGDPFEVNTQDGATLSPDAREDAKAREASVDAGEAAADARDASADAVGDAGCTLPDAAYGQLPGIDWPIPTYVGVIHNGVTHAFPTPVACLCAYDCACLVDRFDCTVTGGSQSTCSALAGYPIVTCQ